MPVPRRTFEGRHILAQAFAKADANTCMDLLNLLSGLEANPGDPNLHISPHADPKYPGALKAPFGHATLIFHLESDGLVVRFLHAHFPSDNGQPVGR